MGRNVFKLYLIPGLCVCAMLGVVGAATPPVTVSATHPRVTLCTSCHSESNFSALDMSLTEHCATCHDQGEIAGKLLQLAAATATESAAPASDQSRPIAGMGLPRYYADSRIGDQPNEMISIPEGEFIMGSDERLSDEGPQHVVKLGLYFIDKYEVTNLQYKKFIDATQRRSPAHFENRTFPPGKADHPVVYVSWMDADAYCQWAGKRLPTDQEWEKAARGTDGRRFPWGMEFGLDKANTPQLWKDRGEQGDTLPVGAFEGGKSPYGLYDVSGNVWEWTASWYEAYPGNTNQTQNYGQTYKTLKGGSWWDCSFYQCGISAPTYNRAFFLKSTRNSSFGFRCAKDG